MATNSLPLNPELTFTHISVHMIHILARLQAKRLVQEQLRAEGRRRRHPRRQASVGVRNYRNPSWHVAVVAGEWHRHTGELSDRNPELRGGRALGREPVGPR